ncbi:hypothetical protein D3C73_693560 [compost metagenome]
MHVMAVVANHHDLCRLKTDCLAEGQHHARLRLGAETAVVTGDEIHMSGNAEALGHAADCLFVVAGGDAKLQAACLQIRKHGREIGDRHGKFRRTEEQRVQFTGQVAHIKRRSCFYKTFGYLGGITGGEQAVGFRLARLRVHAAGGQQNGFERCVSGCSDACSLPVYRSPAFVVTDKRTVLVEQDARDRGGRAHRPVPAAATFGCRRAVTVKGLR